LVDNSDAFYLHRKTPGFESHPRQWAVRSDPFYTQPK